jgi:hypothetical protein
MLPIVARGVRNTEARSAFAALALLGALIAPQAASGAGQVTPFTPPKSTLKFTVSYGGSGRWSTTYHSTPPNPGHAPDTNNAHDRSTQRWSLRLRGLISVPLCRPGGDDPCTRIHGLSSATGSSVVTGHIDHVHKDGIFAFDDASIKCNLRYALPARLPVPVTIAARYLARRHAIAISASDPLRFALDSLPGACPSQGDPIDGLSNNYFTPGFSFRSTYGPDRWFTSRVVTVPIRRLRSARVLRISLANTRQGTPPKNCSVTHPAYERCTGAGSWAGTLTLRRSG